MVYIDDLNSAISYLSIDKHRCYLRISQPHAVVVLGRVNINGVNPPDPPTTHQHRQPVLMTDTQAAANMAPCTDFTCVVCGLVIPQHGNAELQLVNAKLHAGTHPQAQPEAGQGQNDQPGRASQSAKMWDGFETWDSDKYPKFSIKSNDWDDFTIALDTHIKCN